MTLHPCLKERLRNLQRDGKFGLSDEVDGLAQQSLRCSWLCHTHGGEYALSLLGLLDRLYAAFRLVACGIEARLVPFLDKYVNDLEEDANGRLVRASKPAGQFSHWNLKAGAERTRTSEEFSSPDKSRAVGVLELHGAAIILWAIQVICRARPDKRGWVVGLTFLERRAPAAARIAERLAKGD